MGVYVDRLPKKIFLIGLNVFRAVLMGIIPCAVSTDTFTVDLLYVLVLLDAVAMAMFSPARLLGAADRSALAIYGSECAYPEHDQPGYHFRPGSERNRDCPVRFTGSALSERSHVFRGCAMPRVGATGNRQPSAEPKTIGGSAWQDFMEGLAFVVTKQRVILLLIMIAGCYGFGASALSTLFPVFANKLLGLGPVEVGYLWSALGLDRWSCRSCSCGSRSGLSPTESISSSGRVR